MKLSTVCYRLAQLAFILFIVVWLRGRPLPPPTSVVDAVKNNAPEQTYLYGDDTKEFDKEFGKTKYTITPHASYVISGLVVSLHHSDSWIDISHDGDPAQTVDLCVVWGKNITTNGYRMVEYDHGDWTCYYRWQAAEAPPFEGSLLSNNHLIPTTPELASLIKSVHVGDQIMLSGTLVDYSNFDEGGKKIGERHTSLIRTDTGNGACEILYVINAKILRASMPWRETIMVILVAVMIAGMFFGFIISMPKHDKTSSTDVDFHHAPDPRDPTDPMNYVK